jgi:lysophospholipase L1-like esterase
MRQLRQGFRRFALATAPAALIWALLAPAAQAAGGVLVVGDSLEVGTSPYLRGLLGGVPLTVDAQTSRPSSTGVEILRSKLQSSDSVVVFDLGTNDDPAQPQALASHLASVRQIAGGRCIVVATLNRPPYNGVSIDGLNQAVRSFAAGSAPAQLVDWHAAALATPGLLGSDGVHATSSGYATRAQLIAQGIQRCLSGAGAGATPNAGPPAQGRGGGVQQPPRAPAAPRPGALRGLGLDPTVIAAALALQLPRLGALGVIVSASLAVSRSA